VKTVDDRLMTVRDKFKIDDTAFVCWKATNKEPDQILDGSGKRSPRSQASAKGGK
jgi:hypothetical protein